MAFEQRPALSANPPEGRSSAGTAEQNPIVAGGQHPRRWVIFSVVSVALLMSSIDQTIVATALPVLHTDLHAPINWAAWTITVYSLGRVLVLPLAGRISDQYGRSAIFLASVALFTAASLACGLVSDIYLLVALRAVQAIGGAAFMPSATGIVVDHFGTGRDRAIGLFTSIIPIGAIIGPLLGGLFVSYWSWRGIFLVNVPIGVGLLAAGRRYIPRTRRDAREPTRLDVTGLILLGCGLLAGMFGFAYLGTAGTSIANPAFVAPMAAAAVAIAAFIRHSRRSPDPFIPMQLLHGKGFGTINLINFLFGASALGFGALVPLYATNRYGISSLASGTLLTARAIGMIAIAGL
jgi:MFS family permease